MVDTHHCTVGVGVPVADALNEAVVSAVTVSLVGDLVTAGAPPPPRTVKVAADVVAEARKLLKTASYSLPFSDWVAVNE